MTSSNKYGKSPENPVNLNSVPASIIFLNNLVSVQGYHIFYHRLGSVYYDKTNIDHYEIMSSEGRYFDIYINIYNEKSNWIPPEGFLFETFPDSMTCQLEEHVYPEKVEGNDLIEFDEKYVFYKPLPTRFEIEDLSNSLKSLPPLERVMLNSFGINGRAGNFPYDIIHELMIDQYGIVTDKIKRILLDVRQRTTQ